MSWRNKFIEYVLKFIYGRGVTPLPARIIIPVFFVLLFNSMATTMTFSFIPKLVKSFGTSEVDTGYKVGILGATLFVGRMFCSFLWGYLADTYGRKKIAVVAAFFLACSTLAFGFTFDFLWATISRLFQGLSMGLIVITKALVIEHADETNKSLGMSILVGAGSLGLIIGPFIGGFLAFPQDQYPGLFGEGSLFSKFGILLPSSIVSVGMLASIILWVCLVPTDNQKKCEELKRNSKKKVCIVNDEQKYLLADVDKENNYCSRSIKNGFVPNGIFKKQESKKSLLKRLKETKPGKVLRNKPCILVSLLYGIYSFVTVGYDEAYPLYAATSTKYNGYGFSTSEIGMSLMIISTVTIILQFTVLSRVIEYIGLCKVFMYCNIIRSLLYPVIPFCAVIENKYLFWASLLGVMVVLRCMSVVGYVCINVFISNSVKPELLASALGLGMTAATVGRAIAVPVLGALYGWSLTNIEGIPENVEPHGFPLNHYFIFFVLSFGGLINAAYVCFLPWTVEHHKTDVR